MFAAIISTVVVVINAIFLRDHPPTPTSKAGEMAKLSTTQSLKSLAKNWNYILFAVSAALTWGSVNFFGAMVEPMVYPFGYSNQQAGILATITLGGGLIGSLLWAAYVDKTKKYKCTVIICSILTIGFTVFFGAGLFLKHFAITAVAAALMGFFAMPLLTLGFELCAELSFPVAEGTSGGLFVLASNLVAVFGVLASDAMMTIETQTHTIYVLALIIGVQVVALIGFCFFKQDLRRLKADKVKPSEDSNSSNENKSDEEAQKFQVILSTSCCEAPREIIAPAMLKSVSALPKL